MTRELNTTCAAGQDMAAGAGRAGATSVILVGKGRMGTLLEQTIAASTDFNVIGSYDLANANELADAAPSAQLVIDFSNVAALPEVCAYVERTGAALVSGTTGLGEKEFAALKALGAHTQVLHSGNYSLGVAVMRRLAREAAQVLADWDIEIVETHHNQKVDAPSGTAKMLLEAVDPAGEASVVYGREGMVGARPKREIGMHALRGGTVAGTHELHFFGTDEEVELVHRATSRQIFVDGALAAARKLLQQDAGYYSLEGLLFS